MMRTYVIRRIDIFPMIDEGKGRGNQMRYDIIWLNGIISQIVSNQIASPQIVWSIWNEFPKYECIFS